MNEKKIVSTSSDLEIYTESFGTQKKPAILLIAGAMAPARFWTDEFCQQLADAGYCVIRYDHRDMGLSSAVDYTQNPYTVDDLAQDAIAVLDAYNIQKADIIGHSMGSIIAQLMALDYPTRVSRITLISSPLLVAVQPNAQEQEILDATWQVLMKNKPTKNYTESVDGFMQSYEYLHGDIPIDTDVAKAYIKDMYERSQPEHIDWRLYTGVSCLKKE